MKRYQDDPTYKFKNSEHSVSYFFDLSKISVVLDKNSNQLKLMNKEGGSVVALESEMDPGIYVSRILTDWTQVPSENNTILLIPPKECKYYEMNTVINSTDKTATLSDILDSWKTCKS